MERTSSAGRVRSQAPRQGRLGPCNRDDPGPSRGAPPGPGAALVGPPVPASAQGRRVGGVRRLMRARERKWRVWWTHGGDARRRRRSASRRSASLHPVSCPYIISCVHLVSLPVITLALVPAHGHSPTMRTWYSTLFFFLLGDLAAADATAGHPDVDPSSELRDGLSALFATPVLSAALRDYEGDADVLLRDVAPDIDADWRTYLASPDRPDYDDPGDLNDGFFRWQMRAGAWIRSPAGTRIRAALARAARAYAERVGGDARGISADALEVWASVHDGCDSMHPLHVHPTVALSGVLYVSVPPGAGDLVMRDPRGPGPARHTRRRALEGARTFEPSSFAAAPPPRPPSRAQASSRRSTTGGTTSPPGPAASCCSPPGCRTASRCDSGAAARARRRRRASPSASTCWRASTPKPRRARAWTRPRSSTRRPRRPSTPSPPSTPPASPRPRRRLGARRIDGVWGRSCDKALGFLQGKRRALAGTERP